MTSTLKSTRWTESKSWQVFSTVVGDSNVNKILYFANLRLTDCWEESIKPYDNETGWKLPEL